MRGTAKPVNCNCVAIATIWTQIVILRRNNLPQTSTGQPTLNLVRYLTTSSSPLFNSLRAAFTPRTTLSSCTKNAHSSPSQKIVSPFKHLVTPLPTKTKRMVKFRRVSKQVRWRAQLLKKVRPEIRRKWPTCIRQFWQAFKATLNCERLSQLKWQSQARGSPSWVSPSKEILRRSSKQTRFSSPPTSPISLKASSVWAASNKYVPFSLLTLRSLTSPC